MFSLRWKHLVASLRTEKNNPQNIAACGLFFVIPSGDMFDRKKIVAGSFTLLAAALLLTAVRLHKGWRRAVAVGIGVVCALACADVLDAEKLLRLYPAQGLNGTYLVRDAAVLAVLLPFSVWWALRAIRRAEPACT